MAPFFKAFTAEESLPWLVSGVDFRESCCVFSCPFDMFVSEVSLGVRVHPVDLCP